MQNQSFVLTCVTLLAIVPMALAESRPIDPPSEPSINQNLPSEFACRFPDLQLGPNVAVLAAGDYAGREVGFQIDQSGHEATQIDVVVNNPTQPVVLILAAYEPTIWNIRWTKGTQIQAVFASGYHKQVIAGLPKRTPTLISTYDNQNPCGYLSYDFTGVSPQVQRLYGRPVTRVYPIQNSSVVLGYSLPPNNQLLTSRDTPPESFYDRSQPLAGPAGLEAAIRRGLLRRATPKDLKMWDMAIAQSARQRTVPATSGDNTSDTESFRLLNAYVVLKPFVYPAGLYGSNAGTFFIPKGVPQPTGNLGHSTVFDFNTLTCTGSSCPEP
jgi:hypothetical protein